MHEPASSAGATSGATPFSPSHRLLTIGALLTVVAGGVEGGHVVAVARVVVGVPAGAAAGDDGR